jgi:hypothetical protein
LVTNTLKSGVNNKICMIQFKENNMIKILVVWTHKSNLTLGYKRKMSAQNSVIMHYFLEFHCFSVCISLFIFLHGHCTSRSEDSYLLNCFLQREMKRSELDSSCMIMNVKFLKGYMIYINNSLKTHGS